MNFSDKERAGYLLKSWNELSTKIATYPQPQIKLYLYHPCFEPLVRDNENKIFFKQHFTKEFFYLNCAINQYLDSSFINIWHLNFY